MEEILLQNSKNITSLINLMKIHEENIKLFKKENQEEQDVVMKPNFYIECDYSSLSSTSIKRCPITRTSFMPDDCVIFVRECGHVFKREPFYEWITGHSTCPRCTAKIV
jgi:predicted Zn-ribbon and HTH transcriptional regulator